MPMKTPREILLERHQGAAPKLDAIRAGVVSQMADPAGRETMSWGKWLHSLRWHFAGLSTAWMAVLILNADHSAKTELAVPSAAVPGARQIWASLREHRRLLLQYGDAAEAQPSALPGRRTELKSQQAEV